MKKAYTQELMLVEAAADPYRWYVQTLAVVRTKEHAFLEQARTLL